MTASSLRPYDEHLSLHMQIINARLSSSPLNLHSERNLSEKLSIEFRIFLVSFTSFLRKLMFSAPNSRNSLNEFLSMQYPFKLGKAANSALKFVLSGFFTEFTRSSFPSMRKPVTGDKIGLLLSILRAQFLGYSYTRSI